MIDTRNIDDLDPRLKNLLVQFRRIQVSKYPLIAVGVDSAELRFIDSRFIDEEESKHKVVGSLFLDKREVSNGVETREETVFVVESHLINTGRFINTIVIQSPKASSQMSKASLLDFYEPHVFPFSPRSASPPPPSSPRCWCSPISTKGRTGTYSISGSPRPPATASAPAPTGPSCPQPPHRPTAPSRPPLIAAGHPQRE